MNKVTLLTIKKEKEDRPRVSGKSSRVKGLGWLGKEPPGYFNSSLEVSKKLVFCCHGISKNEEMMAGYEPCFCRDTCWKEKKKGTR